MTSCSSASASASASASHPHNPEQGLCPLLIGLDDIDSHQDKHFPLLQRRIFTRLGAVFFQNFSKKPTYLLHC